MSADQVRGKRIKSQSHDEFLWRRAAELLEIERLLKAEPQEVSGNYDRLARSCPLFADFGTGNMLALGIALPAAKVEAGIRLLAASASKIIEHDAPFINLILPNGARFSAALPPVSEGPTFSIRLHWRAVRPIEDFIEAPWQLAAINESIRRRLCATTAQKGVLYGHLKAALLHER